MHRLIDHLYMHYLYGSQIKFFVYLSIMIISLIHLSFNLIFGVFAKENLKMYYAVRFIHFPLVISYFSNKNIVILSLLRLSWTCLLSIFFSCG